MMQKGGQVTKSKNCEISQKTVLCSYKVFRWHALIMNNRVCSQLVNYLLRLNLGLSLISKFLVLSSHSQITVASDWPCLLYLRQAFQHIAAFCKIKMMFPKLAEQWQACTEEQRPPPGEHTQLTDYIMHPCISMNAYTVYCKSFEVEKFHSCKNRLWKILTVGRQSCMAKACYTG